MAVNAGFAPGGRGVELVLPGRDIGQMAQVLGPFVRGAEVVAIGADRKTAVVGEKVVMAPPGSRETVG